MKGLASLDVPAVDVVKDYLAHKKPHIPTRAPVGPLESYRGVLGEGG